MNSKAISDYASVNKLAMKLFTTLTMIIFAAYILQVVKGATAVPVFIAIAATDVIPTIIGWILYKRDNDSRYVMYVIAYGYGIFYLVACLLVENQLVFVYCIPVLFVLMLYNNFKMSLSISIPAMIIAIIHAIKFAVADGFSNEAVASMEIETALMILVCVFAIIVSRFLVNESDAKVSAAEDASSKTKDMLDQILKISDELADEITVVSDKMDMLSSSSGEMLTAMREVQTGSTETAESVQNQLIKTEEIQKQVEKVTGAAGNIKSNVDATLGAVNEGTDNIKSLLAQTKASEEAGGEVMEKVEALKASADQMESIVALIKNVASQTSLLALNASIEAARAGEAGRGFAVVATEISNLAGQTQTATGNINELIVNIVEEMNSVATAVSELIEGNKLQAESAEVTAASIDKIVESTDTIRDNSDMLTGIVTVLDQANKEIVESISTISAISEEVSAHSAGTCSSTESNQQIVGEVQSVVDDMKDNAAKLKSLE